MANLSTKVQCILTQVAGRYVERTLSLSTQPCRSSECTSFSEVRVSVTRWAVFHPCYVEAWGTCAFLTPRLSALGLKCLTDCLILKTFRVLLLKSMNKNKMKWVIFASEFQDTQVTDGGDACVRARGSSVAGHLYRPSTWKCWPCALILSYSEICEVLVYSSWEAEDSTKVGWCQPTAWYIGFPRAHGIWCLLVYKHWHFIIKWQNLPQEPCSSSSLS